MRNVWTIARREIRLYFASPVAYIIGLLILLIYRHLFCSCNLSRRSICLHFRVRCSSRSRFSDRADGVPFPICCPCIIHALNG